MTTAQIATNYYRDVPSYTSAYLYAADEVTDNQYNFECTISNRYGHFFCANTTEYNFLDMEDVNKKVWTLDEILALGIRPDEWLIIEHP